MTADRFRFGRYEFAVEKASFRYITRSSSGPGWDFSFSGPCLNDDADEPLFPHGFRLYTEAAPLPLSKSDDYLEVVVDIPGWYDEETGEPYFGLKVMEEHDVSDVRLRFAERDGARYRIEVSGTLSKTILGKPERFELCAWARERRDHAYPV